MNKRIFDIDRWHEIVVTLSGNKTRSALTAFGVFWGVFMLVTLIGGSRGMKSMMDSNFEGFATNAAVFFPAPTSEPYKGFKEGRTYKLNLDDVGRIRRMASNVATATPVLSQWGVKAEAGTNSTLCEFKGLTPEYEKIEAQNIGSGRFINEMDLLNKRKVCVLGKQICDRLFPDISQAVGSYVKVLGSYYKVVGVNVEESNMNTHGSSGGTIMIPQTTMREVLNRGKEVDMICVTAVPGKTMTDDAQPQVQAIIKKAHYIAPDDDQAVSVVNTEAMFTMMDSMFEGIAILTFVVGLGTLLAGIIGVSNIMMVTVKERTTEIGIRRAIGATPGDILGQILSESILLTISSGMFGILFSIFVLEMAERGINYGMKIHATFQVGPLTALAAMIFVIILGSVAGLAPAYRAMSIKPVDAMRDE